jgi:hypothetical protein
MEAVFRAGNFLVPAGHILVLSDGKRLEVAG